MLEVDTGRQLTYAGVVRLADVSMRERGAWGGVGRARIGRTQTRGSRRLDGVEDVVEIATNLEAHTLADDELFEQGRVDEWMKMRANAQHRAVGLGRIRNPLTECGIG